MGLFNRVVDAGHLGEEVRSYAARVALTPRDILGLQKLAINRTQDAQGFRHALLQGAEIDAIAHTSPSVRKVHQVIAQRGLREALSAFQAGEL